MKNALALILLICTAALAGEPTFYCPPEYVQGPRIELPDSAVVKFVYVAFQDSPDTLDGDLVSDIPSEFDNCFSTQSHGDFVTISSTIVDPRPGRSGFPWMTDRPYSSYVDSVGTYPESLRIRRAVASEIVYKIHDAYSAEGEPNPLIGCDFINIIHQLSLLPPGYGGDANNGLSGVEYPDNVLSPVPAGFTAHHGAFHRQSLRTLYEHEFGHLLGLGHMPSSDSFTYGMYAPMRTSLINQVGFIPFHPRHLEQLGWVEPALVVTGEVRNYVLKDIQAPGGQAIIVKLGEMGANFEDEILRLSFHSGRGLATSYPTRGLAIWHAIDDGSASAGYYDIEQAAGRWDQPINQVGYNPVSGIDLMDVYTSSYYRGDPSDFFSVAIDSLDTEVSYRTNPSTWAGETPVRQADQSVELPLVVLARGLTDSTISVDVIPAPRAAVLSPTVNTIVAEGGSLTVTWGYDDYDEILDEVELWFSVDGGDYYDRVAVADYDSHELSWDAEPRERWATNNGRFRLRFTTSLQSDFAGITDSPHTVTIAGNPIPWEVTLSPTDGDILFTSESFDLIWTNRWGSAITGVDLAYSVDSGSSWSAWENGITFTGLDSVNIAAWQPTDDAVTDGLKIKLRFHSSAGTIEDVSEGDAIVYPIGAIFSDDTDSEDTPLYSGTPSAIVPIVADGDPTSFDLIVGIQVALQNTGKYFSNASTPSGALDFEDDTYIRFPNNNFTPGFGALAVADFDGDGLDDLFACRPDNEASQLFWNNGNSFESANSTALSSIESRDLGNATCASWIDVDHDGDLDLYIGRGDSGVARKDLLLIYDDETGEFEDQAANSGLVDPSDPVATTSIAWADIDGDGRLEVVKASEGELQLFRQIAPTEFEEVSSELPTGLPTSAVRCLRWLDFDRDNDLDLLVVRTVVGYDGFGSIDYTAARSFVVYNNLGQFDTCEGVVEAKSIEAGVLDWNLDGWVDILVPPAMDGMRPALIANFQGLPESYPSPNSSFERFKDVADYVGLDETGEVSGSFAGDMNGDGDPDILMGRTGAVDGTWYQGARQDTTLSNSNWLGVLLSSPYRDGEYSATVVLEDGSSNPLGAQVVDAGGSAGGQQARKLVFGLGEYNSNLVVKVYWPGGRVQEEPIGSGSINTSIVVVEDDEFEIDESSVYCELEFDPYTITYDWVFRWETNHWTPSGDDTVYLTHDSGSGCESMPRTLQDTGPSDSIEASVVYQVDATTGAISYLHELRWNGRSCLPLCYYNYEVRSELGTTTDSYDPSSGTYSIVKFPKLCPSSL